ncbi:MAG: TrkA C-terminal domain-containing protein [Clostridium sp.]
MDKSSDSNVPKYLQIATDLAYKIIDKTYQEGDKIYARSAIGSQYSVSSETARRAICVLADWDIVDVEKNSGVIIKSTDNARNFLQQQEKSQSIHDIKRNILDCVERQQQESMQLYDYLSELIEKIECFRSTNPFIPFEVAVTKDSPYMNKSVAEINFWQATFATVIAIRRGNTLIMSPGPSATFRLGDIFYFTGDDSCQDRVHKFMYPTEKETKLPTT